MKMLSALFCVLFLSVQPTKDIYAAVTYNFGGVITYASSGDCNTLCAPIPEGLELYRASVGDTFTGTLTWDIDPLIAADPSPSIDNTDPPWLTYSIDFNGITMVDRSSIHINRRDGSFALSDPIARGMIVDDGLFIQTFDAFRIIFNSSTYVPTDGLPVDLDFSAFDSIEVFFPRLKDYAQTIGGVVTSYSVVPTPPAVWLFGSGLLGLAGLARRRA